MEDRSIQSIHSISEQGKEEVASKTDKWLPISSSMVPSSAHSTLTSSDLVLAIEAGDLSSVLSCLSVVDVSTPLAVWGGGHSSPTLLAVARVRPAVLAALVSRGGGCGLEGLLTSAVTREVVECARMVKIM